MNLAFIPLYIKYLGVESYGLIGVFVTMQAWFVLLDMGLGNTLSREMARFLGGAESAQSIRNLIRSMEVVYSLVAIIIALAVVSASPWLAVHWLQAEKIPLDKVSEALALAGIVISLRWMGTLYRSGITGLQQQVWINASNIIFSTMRGAGVIAVLVWLQPTIRAFFIFQGVLSLLESVVLGRLLYSLLPQSGIAAKFSWQALKHVWRFAGGLMVITFLILMMTQVDKVLLSKLLPLTEFGYYTLAGVVTGALFLLINPISSATTPRLAELVAKNDLVAIKDAYHRYAQLLTITIVPAALVISVFSDYLLLLWTRDLYTSNAVSPIVSILSIGTLLYGLMYLPFQLQMAYGWTRLTVIVSSVSVTLLVPTLFWVVGPYGAIGAAWVWVGANAIFVLVELPFMHRLLMPGELGNWYKKDVFPAVAAALTIVVIGRALVPIPSLATPLNSLAVLVIISTLTLAAAVFAMPLGRQITRSIWMRYFHQG
jgi:O-antigen/teichoic acid export membrane protein